MIQTLSLFPGVTLRHCRDSRFKQGRLTVQFVRRMDQSEASLNALLPVVLLRGTAKHPDLRAITMHLDDLYGASVGELVRRIGDYQTTGFACSFTEDRFALSGDTIFPRVADFVKELLRQPLTESGAFCREYVEGEKKNLLAELEAQRNDKAAYAATKLLETMCAADSFGIPRLGSRETVTAVTAETLYAHYETVLRQSPVELFYVGSFPVETVAALLKPLFEGIERSYVTLPAQTPFCDGGGGALRETQDIAQSRLNLGFVTPITNRSEGLAAMQVFNTLYGAGITSKLFLTVREQMSLCYSIGSGYYSGKGIVTVSAGIDRDQEETARRETLRQLQLCRDGEISQAELAAA